MAKEKVLTIRIDKETKEKLVLLSKTHERSMSSYLVLLVKFAVERDLKL